MVSFILNFRGKTVSVSLTSFLVSFVELCLFFCRLNGLNAHFPPQLAYLQSSLDKLNEAVKLAKVLLLSTFLAIHA